MEGIDVGRATHSTKTMDYIPDLSLFTSSEGVSRFLELPREIRDLIYDYMWTAIGAIKLYYGNRKYTITYDKSFWESTQDLTVPSDNAMWLFTNERILEEGLVQLRRKAVWHLSDGAARSRTLKVSKHIAPALLPYRVVFLDAMNDIDLRWDPTNRNSYCDPQGHVSTVLDAQFGTPQVKSLVLNVSSRLWVGNRGPFLFFDPSVWRYLLDVCPQLERFCVNIERKVDTYHMSLRCLRLRQPYMRDVTEAVAKMGRRLTRGGRETSTDLECIWAEFRKFFESEENTEGVIYWRYTIERA